MNLRGGHPVPKIDECDLSLAYIFEAALYVLPESHFKVSRIECPVQPVGAEIPVSEASVAVPGKGDILII